MIPLRLLLISINAAALAACARLPVPELPGLTPYRIDIQQGNFVSQEMVAQLKPGMSKEQVRFILGTPLVTDIFHTDRWDYVFYRNVPRAPQERRSLSVFFKDDRLDRLAGDVVPAGDASGAATDPSRTASEAQKPAAP